MLPRFLALHLDMQHGAADQLSKEAKFRLLLRRWDTMYCEENLGHCRHELEGGGPNGICYLGSEPWASQHHSHDTPHTYILTLVRT
jgi:hypothetical protein